MILLIDNYDSFSFNLVQQLRSLSAHPVEVHRNDKLSLSQAIELSPSALVFSPGPGGPDETGICRELLQHFAGQVPILGVCLGHQLIAHCYGAQVVRAKAARHGKTSLITHQSRNLFRGAFSPMEVMRYHSLIVEKTELTSLEIDAWSETGEIMALSLPSQKIYGLQFHPESFLSRNCDTLIMNFLAEVRHA